MQKIAYNSAGGVQKTTWYVRDASGNVLSVYEKDGTVAIAQKELPVYGSGRVGIAMRSGSNYEYYYELKDHLGNVRAVVDVNKTVYSSSSYYPFGLAMQKSGSGYRYGYQGEFAEDETQETGWNSFELRMYDPVVGRWMIPDPVREHFSPYLAMGNNPVITIDPDGRCEECPNPQDDPEWWVAGVTITPEGSTAKYELVDPNLGKDGWVRISEPMMDEVIITPTVGQKVTEFADNVTRDVLNGPLYVATGVGSPIVNQVHKR